MSQSSLCPSFRCVDDSKILGIRQEGKVVILPNPLAFDQTFIDGLKNGNAPERRFRFVNTCQFRRCSQWTGKKCGVAVSLMESDLSSEDLLETPECSIRADCRWFQQEGPEICARCPYVITEISVEEIREFFS